MAPRDRREMQTSRQALPALGIAAACLAAVLAHVGSLAAPFFADDWLFLDQVRFRSLPQVLASPDPLGNFFRPLGRQVWFWLLARVGGESPIAFHVANLMCLVVAIYLLALLVRRAAGEQAAVVAAGFMALHYAADVPVLWVSGSQELLSLALALGALVLYQRGRRAPAAAAYFCALLAKEVVLLAPLAAIALDRSGGEWSGAGLRLRARRAWPLGVAALVWLALAIGVMAPRGALAAGTTLTPWGPPATLLLLARVVLALEWPSGAWPFARWASPGGLGLFAIACATLGVLVGMGGRTRARPRKPVPDPAEGLRAGLVWALAGAIPVALVAPVWSGYYFLFALAGVALALGSLAALKRWSGAVAATIVAVAGLASSQARGLEEFATAPSAWSAQSHVNRFYLERGMRMITRAVADLRRQAPAPAPRTTFFFGGLPQFASFQVADGPLVRGVYRDSSLRSYYLSELTRERLERGPWAVFFFDMETGRLVDRTSQPSVFMSIAAGHILSDRLEAAEAALEAAGAHGEYDRSRVYLAALVARARGDSTRSLELLEKAGHHLGRDGSGAIATARRQLAAGDTLAAVVTLQDARDASVLDPRLHGLLADILLSSSITAPAGEIEAFAARVLAPDSPEAWRRWAMVLAGENRQRQSFAAFDRYFALRPAAALDDTAAVLTREIQRRMLPGGDLTHRAIADEMRR